MHLIHAFIAALFTIAKIWKQPKCSLIGEWVKKMWRYGDTVEYCLVIKNNEIFPLVKTQIDLEGIMQINQTKIRYDFTFTWNLKTKTNEQM